MYTKPNLFFSAMVPITNAEALQGWQLLKLILERLPVDMRSDTWYTYYEEVKQHIQGLEYKLKHGQ